MHSEVDSASGESFFDLFREHPLGTNLRESNVGDLVASGVDNFDLNFMAVRLQKRRDVISLPKSQLRPAGADAEFRHGKRSEVGGWTKAKGGRLGRLRMVLYRA